MDSERVEIIKRLWAEIHEDRVPMFYWDNYFMNMRYYYNAEDDSLDCECGLRMPIEIPTSELSRAALRDKIQDFEDLIFKYYLKHYGIKLSLHD